MVLPACWSSADVGEESARPGLGDIDYGAHGLFDAAVALEGCSAVDRRVSGKLWTSFAWTIVTWILRLWKARSSEEEVTSIDFFDNQLRLFKLTRFFDFSPDADFVVGPFWGLEHQHRLGHQRRFPMFRSPHQRCVLSHPFTMSNISGTKYQIHKVL